MKLSELENGKTGLIVKVYGHGGFRKRIVDMGFVRGTKVKAVLNAPYGDPVKYQLMDFEVSLRRAEAELVEIVDASEALNDALLSTVNSQQSTESDNSNFKIHNSRLDSLVEERCKDIHICFVGNPNCGKTSLFNIAGNEHERVGNYSGVTVDAKTGKLDFEGYHFTIVDLPGTYSLSSYYPEEIYVRKYIIEKTPDVVVNVVDSSNLERNLYLTTQLIDMDVPLVMAMNMYDEFRATTNELDINQLGVLLGTPIVPTVGRTGEGLNELLHTVIDVYEGRQSVFRHIHINHGRLLEDAIEELEVPIRENPEPHHNYSGRFLAIKLLENDKQVEGIIRSLPNSEQILMKKSLCMKAIEEELEEDSESAITDAKYGFIQGALKECLVVKAFKTPNRVLTKRIDAFVTNKWLGHTIFLALMFLMFYCTFAIGQYPKEWIESLVGWISDMVSNNMDDGILKDLVVDGMIAGVGGVIVFLPNILILYAFISWMEDTGYMARVAFIMDKFMHKMGLHGKSFIPMIMGFGCNIPAIMATRTIEDRKSRLITMMIIPLMSCSARLPVYIIIIGAFFPYHQALVLFLLYLIGIVMSVLMAHLFSRFVVKGESSPFVMELPPYRFPSGKSVARHTWEKGREYLKKMGTTILAASVIVWALTYFPQTEGANSAERMEQSYAGQIGKAISPIVKPCGMSWKEGVSVLTGIGAKEIVASTMAVLYASEGQNDTSLSTEASLSTVNSQRSTEASLSTVRSLQQKDKDYVAKQQSTEAKSFPSGEDLGEASASGFNLSRNLANSGMTPQGAFAFLVFVLLYMPCIPACMAIKHDSGRWRWPLFTAAYTTLLAWISSALVYQISILF